MNEAIKEIDILWVNAGLGCDDKPAKYPRVLKPGVPILATSATRGDGMVEWDGLLRDNGGAAT